MGLPEKAQETEYAGIRSAFDILKDGAASAARALVDISENGKSEMARMYAAQAVLDRVGLPAKVDVGVTAVHLHGGVTTGEIGGAASTIADRLRLLREQQQLTVSEDGVVIEFPSSGAGGAGGDDNDDGRGGDTEE